MLNKLKILIVCGLSLLFFSAPLPALADCGSSAQAAVQCGVNGASGSNPSTDPTGSFNSIITTILNLLSVAVGIAAVVMIIIAGARFVTSGGSAERVKSAKNALLYAIIGLIVVALAQLIVRFVLRKVTG